MRILLITGSFPPMPCGIGDYTAQLAEALGKRGDTVVAVLTDAAARADRPDAHFEVYPVVKRWKISDFPEIAKVVWHWNPDIIHIQYPSQAYGRKLFPWLLPALFLFMKRATVQTWHEYYSNTLGSLRNILNAIIPGRLVVVRPHYQDMMPAWHRWLIRRKYLQFIPNASSLPRIRLSDSERIVIHERFTPSSKALLVFFGFIYPHKGIELLFDIADPALHHIVLVGNFQEIEPYHKKLLDRIQNGPWSGNVTTTGFLPVDDTGRILAAADAVALPFHDGGGIWNTSLHGAAIQGTFILTTSREQHGYNVLENIYYAHPGDVEDMRQALKSYLGRRNTETNINQYATWNTIAQAHIDLYRPLLN